MTVICPVCGEKYNQYVKICQQCYFTPLSKVFCSENEREQWRSDIVLPFQKYFHEVARMRKMIGIYDRIKILFEEEIQELSSENAKLRSVIEKQKKTIEMMSNDVNGLKQQLQTANKKIAELQEQINNGKFQKGTEEKSKYLGKILRFGRHQGKEIEWIVVGVNTNDLLLLQKNCYFNWPFHFDDNIKNWNQAQIYSWLQKTYAECFSAKEKNSIVDCGKGKIFLLEEFEYNQIRKLSEKFQVNQNWWLSTIVDIGELRVSVVDGEKGMIRNMRATEKNVWVRPAMWIRLTV